MPTLQGKNASHFNSLKLQTLNAIKKIREKRKQTQDFDEQNQLKAQRKELQKLLFKIDDAQDDFIATSMSVAQAEAELNSAKNLAKSAVGKMKSIQSTLDKATELITMLTRFVSLF